MKTLLLVLGICTVSITGSAQRNQLPYLLLTSDTIDHPVDRKYVQVLADENERLTIQEVLTVSVDTAFKYVSSLAGTDSDNGSNYWLRFRVKNQSTTMLQVSMPTGANRADFYLVDSLGNSTHYETGFDYSYKERDGFKKDLAVTLKLLPGKVFTIYYKRYTRRNQPGFLQNVELSLLSTSRLKALELAGYEEMYFSGEVFFEGAIAGLLALAACFNFFFFLTVRERVYLYFSLFLLGYSVSENYWLSDVVLSGNYLADAFMEAGVAIAMFFFLTQFVRSYFRTFNFWPRWDKALKAMLLLLALQFVSLFSVYDYWFGSAWFEVAETVPIVLCIVFLFITMLLAVRRSKTESRFFLLAIAPLICFLLIFLLIAVLGAIFDTNDGLIGQLRDWVETWGDDGISITICWAVVTFSWALFNRHNLQRKEIALHAVEKERLAKEKEIERNQLIAQQKIQLENDVAARTAELKQSLEELKSTQSQLIQSEKMASLGELTAGIAHEIQNPLNFVNNFSEVSAELVDEMNVELGKGDVEEAKVIANDLRQNLEKINHHGKRAGDIVKGMLQHSRSSSGSKEPTDIKALADEYLRLAYHGLRARDKTFNATMKTDFDESIGSINIIPQDIGRVILNLITNAFYVVNEKSKQGLSDYEPTVIVSTQRSLSSGEGRGAVIIKVKDNGNGIPESIKEKIFQPFFTTKPTGQGTGLGLSLSYDIVKAHGGELKVETKEGEGSEFVVQLPVV